jgi:hypothetical protein
MDGVDEESIGWKCSQLDSLQNEAAGIQLKFAALLYLRSVALRYWLLEENRIADYESMRSSTIRPQPYNLRFCRSNMTLHKFSYTFFAPT